MDRDEYQGFKNYPTWTVAHVLSNTNAWNEAAKRAARSVEPDAWDAIKRCAMEFLFDEPDGQEPDASSMSVSGTACCAISYFIEQVEWGEVVSYFKSVTYLVSADEDAADYIEEAAQDVFGDDLGELFYEHGQWWCRVDDDSDDNETGEVVYSVVDAEPGTAGRNPNMRVDFERV